MSAGDAMTERNGWRSARGHLVFLLALGSAFALVWWLEQWEAGAQAQLAWAPDPAAEAPPPPYAELTEADLAAARAAWAYFAANVEPATGLADSVAGYPSTTMWDTGSFLLAAISAERLGVLPRGQFDAVVGRALESLAELPRFDGRLPNKGYDTRDLAMVDYDNRPEPGGTGWSALDLARVLVPLDALLRHYPEQAAAAQRVLDRWDLAAAAGEGVLMGAQAGAEGVRLVQEGRLGYEQYGARAFALMGFDLGEALRAEGHLAWAEVYGVEVPVDGRTPGAMGAQAATLSEPYILSALEFGWDPRLADLAGRVLRAQERRWEETGRLTAVSEDHLDRAPRFVFSSVVADGEPWAVRTSEGAPAEGDRTLSAKAALGWDALYRSDYTGRLAQAVAGLRTPEGWLAGRYEASGEANAVLTTNTNAVILEALHYRAFGPILHPRLGGVGTSSSAP